MIRRIRAAWAAFRQPELLSQTPLETAMVLVQVRQEASRKTLAAVIARLEELTDELRG